MKTCHLVRFLLVDDKEDVINEISVEADDVAVIHSESKSGESCWVSIKPEGIQAKIREPFPPNPPYHVFGSVKEVTDAVNRAKAGNT